MEPQSLLKYWLLPCLLVAVAINIPWPTLLHFKRFSQELGPAVEVHHTEYFYNDVTGEVQFVDPGDTPFEDETGTRFWLDSNNKRLPHPPPSSAYVWIEQYSQELKRPFFYNQETKHSTWERPADLAWRRVRLT